MQFEFVTRESVEKRVLVDVTFPLYSKQFYDSEHSGDETVYSRIDQDGAQLRRVTVTIRNPSYSEPPEDSSVRVTVEHDYRLPVNEMDETLGLGKFACPAEQFNEALAKVRHLAESLTGAAVG